MDSMTDSGLGELNMKPQLTEEPKDDVMKINGEVNGSYEEEMDVCEEGAVVNKCAPQTQPNGEVIERRVPSSHENGVENMIIDDEEQSRVSETGNNNCEISDGYRESGAALLNTERTIDFVNNSNHSEDSELDNHRNETSAEQDLCDDGETSFDRVMCVEEIVNKEVEGEDDGDEEEEEETETMNNFNVSDKEELPLHEIPKEVHEIRKKESLEITLVRHPVSAEKESLSDSCEALNMTVHKREENENDTISSTTDSSLTEVNDPKVDSSTKTPEKLEDDDSCQEISPDKSSKKKKTQPLIITPRRSSRNLNKTKSYADKDIYIDELDRKSDDEVQEVVPTDPLADDGKKGPRKTTIVVSDTKRLVEIAAGSKQSRGGKKEPTLVIIDTNSILSGKGAVAVSQTTLPQMTITPTPPRSAFSMIPMQVPAQGSYHKQVKVAPAPPVQPPKPVILPTLTDDMYVVEAPSFIVPYVYEKPPVTALKDYVCDLEKNIKEQRAKEEKERQRKKKEKEGQEEEKSKESPEESTSSEKATPAPEGEKEENAEKQEADKKTDNKTESEKEKEENDKPEKEDSSSKSDTETDDEFKDSDDDAEKKDTEDVEVLADKSKKRSDSYFDNPLGKFFTQIGVNLVQEFVQTDLLRNQKRKRDRDGKNCSPEVHMAISSLLRTLECSKENNEPFKLEMKKCNLCSFKTESDLVMAHHLETPHMRNYVYRCNFCTMEVRSPHDILFHMEAVHNVRGRLERAPAFHQCPNCPFEDNQKGKLSRHLLSCAKKYKPERNQEPPLDWEPPAKIPRVRGSRPGLGMTSAMYPLTPRGPHNPLGRMPSPPTTHSLISRGRGRPPISVNRYISDVRAAAHQKALSQMRPRVMPGLLKLKHREEEFRVSDGGMVFRPSGPNSQPQVLLPGGPFQISNNQIFPVDREPSRPVPMPVALVSNMPASTSSPQNKIGGAATAKLLQQPSISITPLPRQPSSGTTGNLPSGSQQQVQQQVQQQQQQMAKPGRPPGSSKPTFVICEICDGYIKDLEQLRNHMQWIHKVKIHPKMIYNRPPLNCQKCQFRFFTDQGLERHLLGSHGLVTSSMQEAANKGKDGGRCPVCGRVYQWKLLNHVARDHNMSLKPAHLSYKCTVCTATFGMYKQFENHVYSAHSVVAKRVMDKKPPTPQPSTSSNSQSESLLKPLKINDEITIIPQPARAKTKPAPSPQKTNKV